jgi:hypothetical protein
VDIEEHLARHELSIDFVARQRTYNRDDFEDVKQAITLLLIERHASPSYDHSKYTLWTYVQSALDGVISDTLNQYYRFKETDFAGNRAKVLVVPPTDLDDEGIANLELLQNIGVVTPINWYHSGYGEQPSSLSPEELELAQKLRANLSDDDITILEARVGRSEEKAAGFLGMPRSTYGYRHRRALARVEELLHHLGASRL